jgi:hypothetical protein
MALIGFEGFDHWSNSFAASTSLYTNSVGQGRGVFGFTNINFNQAAAGTLGGKKILLGAGNLIQASFPTLSSGQLVIGFRFSAAVNITNQIVRFLDSAGGIQCGLELNASGKLIFWRGTNATVLGTGTTQIVGSAEYYIEVKVGFANSANVEVRVNGVSSPAEITLTGVDTTNTANQDCAFVVFAPTAGGTCSYDDFYVEDTSGSAPHNDFLGVCRIETLFGTSNNSVQWTPNASTNVSRINETTMDTDTTFNSDSVAGHIDTFNHGSLSSTPTTIFAVKAQSIARKEDVTNKTFRNKLISGGTTSDGTTYPLTTLWMTYEDYYLVDPNTAAVWTAANANATKNGYEVVA